MRHPGRHGLPGQPPVQRLVAPLRRAPPIPGMKLPECAERESRRLLARHPRRWLHVQGVARLASEVGPALGTVDEPLLKAAAFLHDVGYSEELRATGAHQLDGARYLRSLGLERLACLVAHHSEARFELAARGLADELAAYDREPPAIADALTYCDMLTGPSGEPMTLDQRLADIERRHGAGVIVDALRRARPALEQAVEHTRSCLARHPM